ncbi:MoaD/ThiS family protein [Arthrobacter sp. NPDC057388]|uniref:MoaD/ThiS family protein n=1 Tax=Arthrobacter sp. NPDC057388 TaxID=3346116 RepID=UPI00363DFA88
MLVRYFAAAAAAAGTTEEHYDLTPGSTVDDLLSEIAAANRPTPPAGTPELSRLLSRSSFLRNEVAVRDRSITLEPQDVLDVLPPFAGG